MTPYPKAGHTVANLKTMDPLFQVKLISKTERPNLLMYQALHQDYSEKFVGEELNLLDLSEEELGRRVVNTVVKFAHWGPLEHPAISFATGYFPHSVLSQARTHRIGISFDCQSMRYTGNRIVDFVKANKKVCPQDLNLDSPFFNELERLFYVRPSWCYTDRQGKKYQYTDEQRKEDLIHCYQTAIQYTRKINRGASEEDARGVLSYDFRQHFVVSFTLRALMHFLDLRAKMDAQLEIRQLCELMWPHFEKWSPEIAGWYKEKRWGKARLSP